MDNVLLQMVGMAYGAAAGEVPWVTAIQALGESFQASYAFLLVTDTRTGAPRWHAATDIDPSFFKDYTDHYYKCDVRSQFIRDNRDRTIYFDHLHSNDDQIAKHEYYDFLNRYGSRYYLAGQVFDGDGVNGSLSLHWPAGHGHVQNNQIRRFAQVLPHFRRAVRMGRDIGRTQQERVAESAMLSRFDAGVILVAEDGVVLLINDAGRRIVEQGDNLAVVDGRLRAQRRSDDDALRRLIADPKGPIAVARASGQRPFAVTATRFDGLESALGVVRPAAIVVVSDLEHRIVASIQGLREYFGFTRREAEMASLLAAGATTAEAAERLGIALKTARLHLEHALKKAQTNRQADLIRLVLGLSSSLSSLREGSAH